MKPNQLLLLYLCCCLAAALFLSGCALPRRLWPQADISASETIAVQRRKPILVASRSTEYKELLVAELHRQLAAADIPRKTIGVNDLKNLDTGAYPAVVVINTCLARGLDDEIENFLAQQKSHANIILLTTSGKGTWLPDKRGREFDAISGASAKENVDTVVKDLMVRIQQRLNQQ